MSSLSKKFILEENTSELLYDYISLVFLDKTIYKKRYRSCFSFLSCFDSKGFQDSAICYSNSNKNLEDKNLEENDDTKKFIKWIIDLSIKYLKISNINTDNLNVNIIECIRSEDKILFENSNKATIMFHFNNRKNGYVTCHESNLNITTNDRKYIVVTFL